MKNANNPDSERGRQPETETGKITEYPTSTTFLWPLCLALHSLENHFSNRVLLNPWKIGKGGPPSVATLQMRKLRSRRAKSCQVHAGSWLQTRSWNPRQDLPGLKLVPPQRSKRTMTTTKMMRPKKTGREVSWGPDALTTETNVTR